MRQIIVVALLATTHSYGQYEVNIKPTEDKFANKKMIALMEAEKAGHCKFIPLHMFSPGMKFFFPRDDYKEKDNYNVMFYSRVSKSKKRSVVKEELQYKELAGKLFTITKVEEREGTVFPDTYIILKAVDGDLEIEHRVQIRTEQLKESYERSPGDNVFNMNYAVYTADIDSFKNNYLGKEIYTNFKVGTKKFQKVKIVNVGAGNESAPVRIVFETESGLKDQKDVCTCGTNAVLDELNRFSDLFTSTNPRTQYNGPNEIWDLICEERVKIGMSEQELILAWGKPTKVNQTIVEGKNTKQFVYYKGYVYVDNGIVTGLQNK